ncbi:MAG: restriction endonuclease subunit S [Bacteroidales bacterium]|nr:restriction endonuclease subunit S [Bacteroidales bacterium]
MTIKKMKLGEVCTIEKGKIGIKKAIPGEFPLVVTAEERLSHNEFHFEGKAVVIPLVSSTGHGHKSLKRIHYQSGKFAVGNILCAIMPKDESKLNAEFLYRFLYLNKEKELVGRMKGMANVTLPIKEIAKIEIPVPSISEQKAFVEEYKILEETNIDISTELTHQLTLIKQLRQAFLREAMQGKLTSNWREENPDVEPASELLKKIKAEKEKLIKEGKLKKQKPLPPIKQDEIPFEIPEGWVWCRLGDSCIKITDGTHHSPINTASGNFMYVTAKNIKDDGVDLSNITYVTRSVHDDIYSRCDPKFGDILYIKDGATTGIVTINNIQEPFSLLSSVALIKIDENIFNRFLMYVMRSPVYYEAARNNMYGVALTRVTLAKINSSIMPLPPLSEQQRIVSKLDKLMTYCDQLEESIKKSQQQNEMLLQQVLREALEQKEETVSQL